MDKPEGPTSHDCVVRVRRALGTRRVGHLGTLDPFASGLLVLVAGAATRLARLAQEWSKDYEGMIRLGATTTTDDRTGQPLAQSDRWRDLGQSEVAAAMRALEGESWQEPPAFSAKKVAGERAYRRARRGEPVTLAPVRVRIEGFSLTAWTPPDVAFTVRVSSGTYVRALARTLGETLGCGAHLAALRRVAVGPFGVAGAKAPTDVTPADLAPPESLAAGWPRRELSSDELDAVVHGRPIAAGEVTGAVALFADGSLAGIGETEGEWIKPRVVLPPV